jgi:hypothetical protein
MQGDPFEGTQYSLPNMVKRHGGYWDDVWALASSRVHTPTTTLTNDDGITMTIDNREGDVTIVRGEQSETICVEGLDDYLTDHGIAWIGWTVLNVINLEAERNKRKGGC